MRRYYVIAIMGCALFAATWISPVEAQLTEFAWNGTTGAQDWQVNGNWDMADFPNDPQHVANLSVALGTNLTLDLGATDVTVAGLNIGGMASGVTTDITSSGALLRFQNDFVEELNADADFSNNSRVGGEDFLIWQRGNGMTNQLTKDNGDADRNGTVDGADLVIWQENYGENTIGLNGGQSIITTAGTTGTINRIAANVRLVNENLEVRGGTNLIFNGNTSYEEETPTAGEIGASISNSTAGITTTINGTIDISNKLDTLRGDFGLNTSQASRGSLIVNGVIEDNSTGLEKSDLWIGVSTNNAVFPLHTVRLNSANTYTGGTTLSRVNLELADDAALGTGTIGQRGPNNQYGFNLVPVNGDRTIANDINVQHNLTFKGSQNLTLAGDITQGNNKSFVNLIDAGKTLTLTGRLDIFNDDGDDVRDFEFDGTGTTVFNGIIRDDEFESGMDRRIHKSGTGVLIIDVGSGDNRHSGPTTIAMGNFHYANNDSLNAGPGKILSRGGAIGVDTGVASNSTLNGKIDPASTGGLMLAPGEAAANLNFTSTLSNAAGMTVAAPETGLTYTGTITPGNSTYGLGGGTGTLTLPDVQLTGANSLEVRNGGSVELFGDNTYTGSTTIITQYTSSRQEQAAANSDNSNDADSLFYDRLVAPTLVVDDLANGGSASSIGSAASEALNLEIQGSTLKYVGTGDSTDRLFTIGTGGATLDSSGTGAVVFSNPGSLVTKDAVDLIGDVDDFTGVNSPNVIYNVVGDTSDVVIGMPVSDPDPGGAFTQPPCEPDGANCIPAGTVVTGVSADGKSIGISNDYPFVQKNGTRIVFGVVDRTLTLSGSNADNNTIASIISDSANGGVVNLTKDGSGTWVLTGNNTYSGDTTVEQGMLSISNAFLDDTSTVNLLTGGVLDLDFSGNDLIDSLFINGTQQADGLWGAIGNGAAAFTSSLLSGSGLLNVGGVPLGALATVPEPGTLLLASVACLALAGQRKKFHRA